MSSFRHPVGPQPPGVYWRRRLMVLGVIVLVVVVVVLIIVGRGSGSSAASGSTASASTSTTTAATVTSTPTADAAVTPTASSTPTGGATATARAKDGATCKTSQVTLKPIVDKSAYAATEDPKIAMSITNTGSNSCRINLGSAQQVLTITSGSDTYWTSKDCQTGGTNQEVTIGAGKTLTTPSITWDRTRSSTKTCDDSRPSVTAGGASYHLKVSVGNITSATEAQFVLS